MTTTPLEPLSAALQCWQNFYVLAGTAAATLTGLMFVAVTFGASLVTRESATAARAFIDPIYMHFAQVLLTSCLLTIPTLDRHVLGGVLLIAALARLAGLVWIFRRYLEAHRNSRDLDVSDWLSAILGPLLCHLLLGASGVGLLLGYAPALTGLAIVNLALLFLGVYGAWELVVWMALAISERRREPPPPGRA
jgi:hypothetical protein